MAIKPSPIVSGLMGVCVGDALGVPVEFTSRADRTRAPVRQMQGYGTWNQPPGTWSDDSSLTFCLAESLCQGFDLENIGQRFCRWYAHSEWTAHGAMFDIGNTTYAAIQRLQQGVSPLQSGETGANSNGNGSLMRILPLAYCHSQIDWPTLLQRVHQVSAITHAHLRSQMACGLYISIAICLLQGADRHEAYQQGLQQVAAHYQRPPYRQELPELERVLNGAIATLPVEAIQSGGYVVHTLEAALWCLLNSNSYADAVLQAVNLGDDTDTTAAVTGGLAGIHYGVEQIPAVWIEAIARQADILDLAQRLESALLAA